MILHEKLSKPRYIFRYTLLVVLALSLVFTATATYFMVETRTNPQTLREVGPVVFYIDATLYTLKARFQDPEEQFTTAKRLCAYSFFSPAYGKNCLSLIMDLSDDGFAPAQTYQANIIMRTAKTPEEFQEAVSLYRAAAAQNYEPAQIRLALLENIE